MKRFSLALLLSVSVHLGAVGAYLYFKTPDTKSIKEEKTLSLARVNLVKERVVTPKKTTPTKKPKVVEPMQKKLLVKKEPTPKKAVIKQIPTQKKLMKKLAQAKPKVTPKKLVKKVEPLQKLVHKEPQKEKKAIKVEKKVIKKEPLEKIVKKNIPLKKESLAQPVQKKKKLFNAQKEKRAKAYKEDIKARIMQALLQKRSYPRSARRRGLEGKALITFNLNPNGSIHVLHVKASHSLFEKAALKTLFKASTLFPKPTLVLEFSVPLHYSLKAS